MTPRPSSVELHIEELVLRDFDPADRHHIGEAVERELARLLAAGAVAPSLRRNADVARLDFGTLRLAGGSSPLAAGEGIARAIHQGLTG